MKRFFSIFSLSIFLFIILLNGSVFSDGQEWIYKEFAEAKPDFSPVPIWWWSGGKVTKEGITWQLQELVKGGIHNAIILNLAPSGPLYGSAPDDPLFLTDEWWDLFAYTLQVAKQVGVRIWFYDQLGFSGAGLQARVVRDNPEYRGIALKRFVKEVTGPGAATIETPAEGNPLALFRSEKLVEKTAPSDATPEWIWGSKNTENTSHVYFRRIFELTELPPKAVVTISCDNGYELYINGKRIGNELVYDTDGWETAEVFDVLPYLQVGKNVIAVHGTNLGGPGGLIFSLRMGDRVLLSDNQWRIALEEVPNWLNVDFNDENWKPAVVIGSLGCSPWNKVNNMDGGKALHALGTPVVRVSRIPINISERNFTVEVPEGSYQLELFYIVPAGFDYHNPAACHALLDKLHGEIERRFPEELGKTIAGSFQDEFPPTPRFSYLFMEEFKKRKGYDILDYLPALFEDVTDRFGSETAPSTVKVRCDAADVAASLAEEAFFIPLYQWHEKYGMLCGYDQTVRNGDPFRGESYYVDYFKTMRHFSVPGNDMDGDCKPHQSMADLYKRPRVWAEVFHSSGWGQTLEEIAVLFHPWLLNGATLFDPHAIYYSIHGSYWEWAPPDTGWRQPYFVHYKTLADYNSRLCWLLSRGNHKVEVAVIHPATTTHAYIGYQLDLPTAKQVADAYWNVQNFLRKHHIDYIIMDEDSLAKTDVSTEGVKIHELNFKVFILPSCQFLRSVSVEKLSEYANLGGKVYVYGFLPEQISDVIQLSDEQRNALINLREKGQTISNLEAWALQLRADSYTSTAESVPVLERDVENKPFYFVMSDEGTPATSRARFDINKRALYETPSAKCEVLQLTLNREGIPEFWNAVTGKVETLWNYSIENGKTKVAVDLSQTAAPLVSVRNKSEEDIDEIKSDLKVLACKEEQRQIQLSAMPFFNQLNNQSVTQTVYVRKGTQEWKTTVELPPTLEKVYEEPFAFQLIPTCDNKDGSFAYPPYAGPIPVETRAFKGQEERDTNIDWLNPDYDDSAWEMMLASFGPRARWKGPLALPENTNLDSLQQVLDLEGEWKNSEYSLKLGINEDPVFSSALGGKGRIPEEFIDLGRVGKGKIFHIQCFVELPPEGVPADQRLNAILRVGATAKKKVFLNKIPVAGEGSGDERVFKGKVQLSYGVNVVDVFVESIVDGRLRLYVHFMPESDDIPTPEWIWSNTPSPTGRTKFVRVFDIPAEIASAKMVVALGDIHQIYINGQKISDQGNFDPYFTSRAEQYDIKPYLKVGENSIEIIARDVDDQTGLLLDSDIQLVDGKEVVIVSDANFKCIPEPVLDGQAVPVKVLPQPAHGYMGDPALLLIKQRPHPLPLAGWLQDQPEPPKPFNELTFFPSTDLPVPYRFRFLLPPGAKAMNLKCVGKLECWVNGTPLLVEGSGPFYKIILPEPESPRRVACLRIETKRGFEKGAAILEPITYEMGEGNIPLGSWDELGFLHYSGGMEYRLTVEAPAEPNRKVYLSLGRVRGTVEVFVNGVSCGTCIWHPYLFDITSALTQPTNDVRIRVFNTLGPHFAIGHPSAHVFEGHTKSGIFGPIKTLQIPVVNVTLQ